MKKGQILSGVVERIDFPNKGVVHSEEGTCIVKNVLPGQQISFVVSKTRNKKAEGRLLEVIQKSPLETESRCPHFGVCGGCTYLSIPYKEQLKIKEDQIHKLLCSVLDQQDEEWRFEGIQESPAQYEYRNKMEFSFGDEVKDGPLMLGMHKRGSFYDIVSVEECQLVDEDYRTILKRTRQCLQTLPFFHKLKHIGLLRHLLVRKAAKTGEILVALVTTSMDIPEQKIEEWKNELLKLDLTGHITGVLHIINDSPADVVKSDETRVLFGQDYIFEELLGLKFKISTFSFFQTNSYGAQVLYRIVRDYVGDLREEKKLPDKVVYDLYSGTGTIAQMMAPVARKVIGVEIVEEAVLAARQNAELNHLTNCEFIAGDVLKVLDQIEEKPDMIILDPPRDGIHPKALSKIIQYHIPKLVYISCKPTSLIRDLEVFLANGYIVEKAVAVDQFPFTANTETIALLKKKGDYVHEVYTE